MTITIKHERPLWCVYYGGLLAGAWQTRAKAEDHARLIRLRKESA